MSRDWKQVCRHPDGRTETVVSQYELLCREAKALGLHVEIRMVDGCLVELGLSNGLCVDLRHFYELQWCALVLRDYLDREMG